MFKFSETIHEDEILVVGEDLGLQVNWNAAGDSLPGLNIDDCPPRGRNGAFARFLKTPAYVSL